jgi:hypothetical protein
LIPALLGVEICDGETDVMKTCGYAHDIESSR